MTNERMDHVTIIADNGGGIAVQIEDDNGRWQHNYLGGGTRGDDPAADIVAYVTGTDHHEFEGDDTAEFGWLDPSNDDIRNGGYRVLSIADVLATDKDDSWASVRELKESLCRVALEGQDSDDLLRAAVREVVERN